MNLRVFVPLWQKILATKALKHKDTRRYPRHAIRELKVIVKLPDYEQNTTILIFSHGLLFRVAAITSHF